MPDYRKVRPLSARHNRRIAAAPFRIAKPAPEKPVVVHWEKHVSAGLRQEILQQNPSFDFKKLYRALDWWQENNIPLPVKPAVDDYFSHPIKIVSQMLKYAKVDEETIIASVVYPSARARHGLGWDAKKLDAIKQEFGDNVRELAECCLKLRAHQTPRLAQGAAQKLEDHIAGNLLSGLLVTRKSAAVLIRSAQKMDNLEREAKARADGRPGFFPPHIAQKMVEDGETFHAPLAYLAGRGALRYKIRDLCYELSDPEDYKKTCAVIAKATHDIDKHVKDYIKATEERFGWKNGREFSIVARPKSPSSARDKAKRQKLPVEKIKDASGIRFFLHLPVIGERGHVMDFTPEQHKELVKKFEPETFTLVDYFSKEFKEDDDPKQHDDFIRKPKANGYSGAVHMLLHHPVRTEMQVVNVVSHHYNSLGDSSHDLYKTVKSEVFLPFIKAAQELVKHKEHAADDLGVAVRDHLNQWWHMPSGSTVRDFLRHTESEICSRVKAHGGNLRRGTSLSLDTVLQSGWQLTPG